MLLVAPRRRALELVQPGIVDPDWLAIDPPGRRPARDPRRLPDPGHADRRDRPVGRRGRLDGGLPDGHPATGQGAVVAIIIGLVAATLAGLVNGIGVGVFKVHPLIMTLGMGLVVLGLMSVYQLAMVQSRGRRPRRSSMARLRR